MPHSRRKYTYLGVPEDPGYYVYELWAGGTCLYVGRVGNSGPQLMRQRLAQHRGAKPWFPQVTHFMVTAYSSHEEIVVEERRRIFELQPVHNRAYRRHQESPVEYAAWRAEYKSRPEVREREEVYFHTYNNRPERVASERAREAGGARHRYYGSRNALPAVKERKRRWAVRASRRPGPGQGAMF